MRLSNLKILIVDRDTRFLDNMRNLLLKYNLEVRVAENLFKLFHTVAEFVPDVILMNKENGMVDPGKVKDELLHNPLTERIQVIPYLRETLIEKLTSVPESEVFPVKFSLN